MAKKIRELVQSKFIYMVNTVVRFKLHLRGSHELTDPRCKPEMKISIWYVAGPQGRDVGIGWWMWADLDLDAGLIRKTFEGEPERVFRPANWDQIEPVIRSQIRELLHAR